MYASSGNPIKIQKKSAAILADIEQMIDDTANTETIDEIVIDRGTHETTSEVSVADIKENIAQLLRNGKTVKPTITVSSVLPSKYKLYKKRALKCIFPGLGYAEILRRVNLDTLNIRRDSTCQKYFDKIKVGTRR